MMANSPSRYAKCSAGALGTKVDGAASAVEKVADAGYHLFAEGGHRALDHVVGHYTELEDQRQAHQVEPVREAENGIRHRLRATEQHHVVGDDLLEAHRVQHGRLPAPEIVAVGQPAAVGELRIAVPQFPILSA